MKTSAPKELLTSKKSIDKRILLFFNSVIQKAKKTDPSHVHVYTVLRDYCLRNGKRLRGYLVLLGYKIAGKKQNAAILDIAVGMELMHAALLIHDDIIDNDVLRRGDITLHEMLSREFGSKKKGIEAAKAYGDILTSLALDIMLDASFPAKKKVEVFKIISSMSLSTANGELMDIVYSFQGVDQKIVEKILLLKTARYTVSLPLAVGYVLGGGKKFLALLKQAGELFGIAFQIRDDTLGVFGKKAEQNMGSDFREAKPFVLAPLITKHLSKQQQKTLKNISKKVAMKKDELKKLQELMEIKKISHKAFELAETYRERAKKQLARIRAPKVRKELLSIIDYVLERND